LPIHRSRISADVEGTTDLEKLGGLWEHLKWTAPFVLAGCAAVGALPPFNGFVSEWMTFQSLIAGLTQSDSAFRLVALAAIAALALTGGLAATAFVKAFGVAFLGRSRRAQTVRARETFDPPAFALGTLAALCVVFGLVPILALVPLARVSRTFFPMAALPLPSTPYLSAYLLALPLALAFATYAFARRRGVTSVPTWTCGSPVTATAQYSATGFSKPLRTIFSFVLVPQRRLNVDLGSSSWFPQRIVYQTRSRYLADEAARRFSAFVLAFARRSRGVQSGSLRLYLMYAVLTIVLAIVVAR
jgi:hydrogenase-4 component B